MDTHIQMRHGRQVPYFENNRLSGQRTPEDQTSCAKAHMAISREKVETHAIKSRDNQLLLTGEVRCAVLLPNRVRQSIADVGNSDSVAG